MKKKYFEWFVLIAVFCIVIAIITKTISFDKLMHYKNQGDVYNEIFSEIIRNINGYAYVNDREYKQTIINLYKEKYITSGSEYNNEKKQVNNNIIDNEVIEENKKFTKKNNIIDLYNEENVKFIPSKEKAIVYSEEELRSEGFIKKAFYTEDPTTYISNEQLNYNKLISYDTHIKKNENKPQILIYHTHSQERYKSSDDKVRQGSVVDVGDELCRILHNQYGYNVIHSKEQYDLKNRDYAYSRAMEGLEKVLEENPTIEVIIDLHRDETPEDVHLVKDIQGIPMAKFMFFNGLSYTREIGEIIDLPNKYINENIAFGFKLKLAADEYYPGLARKTYLKGYRYNMHFRPRSILIELGSQTNSYEEALNACKPLAHIIDIVLS